MPRDIDIDMDGFYQRGYDAGYRAATRLAPYRVHEDDIGARLPTIHPVDLMQTGDPPIEPHYINKDEIEADGWHCTRCGESIDFDGGDPFHDDQRLNPQ